MDRGAAATKAVLGDCPSAPLDLNAALESLRGKWGTPSAGPGLPGRATLLPPSGTKDGTVNFPLPPTSNFFFSLGERGTSLMSPTSLHRAQTNVAKHNPNLCPIHSIEGGEIDRSTRGGRREAGSLLADPPDSKSALPKNARKRQMGAGQAGGHILRRKWVSAGRATLPPQGHPSESEKNVIGANGALLT